VEKVCLTSPKVESNRFSHMRKTKKKIISRVRGQRRSRTRSQRQPSSLAEEWKVQEGGGRTGGLLFSPIGAGEETLG